MNQIQGLKQINSIPRSVPTENKILGCILTGGSKILKQIVSVINENDFWDLTNKSLYLELLKQDKIRGFIDYKYLDKRFKNKHISILADEAFTETDLNSYLKELKRTSNLRQLISAGAEIQELGLKELEIDEVLSKTNKLLAKINTNKSDRLKKMDAMLVESMQRMNDRANNKGVIGVETGFIDLDKILHGYRKGSLNTLAARPSVGKTSLAISMAMNAARKGFNILFFSLEQSSEELIDKLICMQGNINLWAMQGGFINDEMMTQYGYSVSDLSKLNIIIDDNGGITPAHIISTIEKVNQTETIDLIIIDYLQLMTAGFKTNNRVEEVSYISGSLKTIAKKYNLPILALAQLNRSSEIRGDDSKIKLSDLRDSGSIEQDSDVVMFLKRKTDDKKENLLEVELTIAKHRAGPTGIVDLLFEPKTTNFKNKLKNEQQGEIF